MLLPPFYTPKKFVVTSPVVPLDGLNRYYWAGNAGILTNWPDNTTNDNDGILDNGVTRNTGFLALAGNSGILTPAQSLSFQGAVILRMRFYQNGNQPDVGNIVDCFSNVTFNGHNGWACGINLSDRKLTFYTAANGGIGGEGKSNYIVPYETWFTVVFSYGSGVKKIWVNGVLDNSFGSNNDASSANSWGVGRRYNSQVGGPRYCNMDVSAALLYIRDLTVGEVEDIHDALSA